MFNCSHVNNGLLIYSADQLPFHHAEAQYMFNPCSDIHTLDAILNKVAQNLNPVMLCVAVLYCTFSYNTIMSVITVFCVAVYIRTSQVIHEAFAMLTSVRTEWKSCTLGIVSE